MPKYQLNVMGRNYMIRFHPTHRAAKHGFYTKFFIEAASPEEAEGVMVGLIRVDRSINDFVCNAPDDPAMFEVEKMYEIADWPDCARPRMGLAWFPEDSAKPSKVESGARPSPAMHRTAGSLGSLPSMKFHPQQTATRHQLAVADLVSR